MWVQSLGWEDPLEKGMATHSSTLAWRIPWTEELEWALQDLQGHKEWDTTEVTQHTCTQDLNQVCGLISYNVYVYKINL